MLLNIQSYPLPSDVLAKLTELAKGADAFFIGETHGTQEIPRIVVGLLPMLYERGYRGFGVEVPRFEQDNLRRWLSDPTAPVPDFYAKPGPDGRGSREMLALVRCANQTGFQVFCFDPGLIKRNAAWTERDAGMSQNTQETWQKQFPDAKILLMCGNNHAFLKPPPRAGNGLWPSFAEQLRQRMPDKGYRSIDLMPVSGEFYNMGIKNVQAFQFLGAFAEPLEIPRAVPSEYVSLQVDLPQCHAATFLSPPKVPSQLQLLRLLLGGLRLRIKSLWRSKSRHS
ncbi:MAG TPA: hypothetical protein VFR47_23060 [Anaerolineales bacterium]|nr:hypothetical protein [Anaerolineales bacterium]